MALEADSPPPSPDSDDNAICTNTTPGTQGPWSRLAQIGKNADEGEEEGVRIPDNGSDSKPITFVDASHASILGLMPSHLQFPTDSLEQSEDGGGEGSTTTMHFIWFVLSGDTFVLL